MSEQQFNKGDVIVPADQHYPMGALSVDGYDGTGCLLAHPLGGGLQFIIPPAKAARLRLVPENERQAPLWRKAKFEIEGVEGQFEGWTDGRRWNGWAMPAFEFTVAQEVAKAFEARYDQRRDCFITRSQEDEAEVWQAQDISVLGGAVLRVFPIGAGAWIWDDVQGMS